MTSWVCNAADLRRLRRTEEPQQRSVHTSHTQHQPDTMVKMRTSQLTISAVQRGIMSSTWGTSYKCKLHDQPGKSGTTFSSWPERQLRWAYDPTIRQPRTLVFLFCSEKTPHDEIQAKSDKDIWRRGLQKTSSVSMFQERSGGRGKSANVVYVIMSTTVRLLSPTRTSEIDILKPVK